MIILTLSPCYLVMRTVFFFFSGPLVLVVLVVCVCVCVFVVVLVLVFVFMRVCFPILWPTQLLVCAPLLSFPDFQISSLIFLSLFL